MSAWLLCTFQGLRMQVHIQLDRYSSFWILFSGGRESALRAAGKEGPLKPERAE